jgi:hypothetical protein
MKTKVTMAVLGAIALSSGAAHAAFTSPVNGTNGSDLVVFVSDATTGNYFAYDTGVSVDSLRTRATIQADGNMAATATPISISAPTFGSALDTALAAFLATTGAGDTITWAVQGVDSNAIKNTAATQRFVTTSSADLSGAVVAYAHPSNSQLGTIVGTVSASTGSSGFWNELNAATFTNNVSTTAGFGKGTLGAQDPGGFGQGLVFGGVLGTSQNMYLYSNNTSGTAGAANVYETVAYSLNWNAATGIASLTATAVPLPAAAWLFGSGLLGLMGVGRRRQALSA